MIRGLTLTHPWAWCIAHAGKNIENRSWHPSRQGGQIGMYLAIHGGVVPGKNSGKREEARMDLAHALAARLITTPKVSDQTLMAWSMGLYVQGEEQFFTPGIVAVARLSSVTKSTMSAWAVEGQYHWQLEDIFTLPYALKHRGAQGLWELDAHVLIEVRELWMGRGR